jgi:hypothetical protein
LLILAKAASVANPLKFALMRELFILIAQSAVDSQAVVDKTTVDSSFIPI